MKDTVRNSQAEVAKACGGSSRVLSGPAALPAAHARVSAARKLSAPHALRVSWKPHCVGLPLTSPPAPPCPEVTCLLSLVASPILWSSSGFLKVTSWQELRRGCKGFVGIPIALTLRKPTLAVGAAGQEGGEDQMCVSCYKLHPKSFK